MKIFEYAKLPNIALRPEPDLQMMTVVVTAHLFSSSLITNEKFIFFSYSTDNCPLINLVFQFPNVLRRTKTKTK